MKKLVFNGCSFFRQCWPFENPKRKRKKPLESNDKNIQKFKSVANILATDLNMENHNISVDGSSNQSICERTIDFLLNDASTGDIIILGLSDFARERGFIKKNKFGINFYDWTPYRLFNDKKNKEHKNYYIQNCFNNVSLSDAQQYIDIMYSHFVNDESKVKDLKRWIKTIKVLCEYKQVHLLLFSTILTDDELSKELGCIPFPNGKMYWKSWIKSYDKNYGAEHPNDEDNELLADFIKNILKDKNII